MYTHRQTDRQTDTHTHIYVYVCIYVYRERERERDRERESQCLFFDNHACVLQGIPQGHSHCIEIETKCQSH